MFINLESQNHSNNRPCHGFRRQVTRRQTCEKLQCLYENLMSNNFRKRLFWKKCELWTKAKQKIVLKDFGGVSVLKFLRRLVLDFPYICLQFFSGLSYRQMYRNLKKNGSRSSNTCSALIFVFDRILRSEAVVENSYFFQNSRFTEIIRH